jgi:hypothetical protein
MPVLILDPYYSLPDDAFVVSSHLDPPRIRSISYDGSHQLPKEARKSLIRPRRIFR